MERKDVKAVSSWPKDGTEYISECPVCGSNSKNSSVVYSGLTDRIFFCAPGEWTLVRCHDCSSGYLNPRPNKATIGLAYRSYFTHESDQTGQSTNASLVQRFRWALGNGYRNWRFGTNTIPASRLGVLAVLLNPSRHRSIDASMRHLPKPREGQMLLDFGCGNGSFLKRAKAAGWSVVGMDFDPMAVSSAKAEGLEVYQGGTDTLLCWTRQFDIITLSHVIEHVHEPLKLLRACFERLKPGGSLWIETPNFSSQGHHLYGKNWRGLEPPRHLVLFTPKSLLRAITDVGFTTVSHQTENPEVRSVFLASEAIRENSSLAIKRNDFSFLKYRNLKHYERQSLRNVDRREFITVKAFKPT